MNVHYIGTPLLLAIVISLSSCITAPTTTSSTEVNPPAMTAEAKCTTDGGEWRPLTRGEKPTCNQKFSDAGKGCNDGTACTSNTCLAPREANGVAQCAATTSAVIHAGCTGGKMVNGTVVPVGCP